MQEVEKRRAIITPELKRMYKASHAEGVTITTVRDRIRRGMSPEEAITTPKMASGSAGYSVSFRGSVFKCISDACVYLNIERHIFDTMRNKYKSATLEVLVEAFYRIKQYLPDTAVKMRSFPRFRIGSEIYYSLAQIKEDFNLSSRNYYQLIQTDDFLSLMDANKLDVDNGYFFVNFESFFDGTIKYLSTAELTVEEIPQEPELPAIEEDDFEPEPETVQEQSQSLPFYVTQFINLARSEFSSVQYYNRLEDYRRCCISSCLTCEYYLKALFYLNIKSPTSQWEYRSHSLKAIAKRLLMLIPDLSKVTLPLQTMTSYYSSMRYPSTVFTEADKEDSDLSFNTAITVTQLVEQYLTDNI